MGPWSVKPAFRPPGRSTDQRSQFTCLVNISTYHPNKASILWTAVRYFNCSYRYLYGVGRYGRVCTCTATAVKYIFFFLLCRQPAVCMSTQRTFPTTRTDMSPAGWGFEPGTDSPVRALPFSHHISHFLETYALQENEQTNTGPVFFINRNNEVRFFKHESSVFVQ